MSATPLEMFYSLGVAQLSATPPEMFYSLGEGTFYFVAALQCILAVFAMRRARDAGYPAFLGLAIFLPYYLGLLALIGLTVLPSQEDAEAETNTGAS